MVFQQPEGLRPGDTIGVAAPASHFDRHKLEKGLQVLVSWGYRVKVPEGLFAQKRYLAGEDQQRAHLLNSLFADPEVKAVFCVRGGYGTMRMLPYLAFDTIRRCPKILLGFSDITALLYALYLRCGLITFHGPNLTTLDDAPVDLLEHLWQMLTHGKCPAVHLPAGRTIGKGKASGRLVGGNLTTLCHLTGTPYQLKSCSHLLFLEDRGEQPYRIDRMLSHMKMAGCFEGVKGVLLGAFTKCGDMEVIAEIVAEIFAGNGIPILMGFEWGHIPRNQTLPVGLNATLDADNHHLEFHGVPLKVAVDFG